MSFFMGVLKRWLKLAVFILFRWVNLIPLIIFIAKILEVQGLLSLNEEGRDVVSNFIEWFGVLYGILLPLILVRVWEQLDEIDREFDREADAIKLLYEGIFYLKPEYAMFGKKISGLLHQYVVHILKYYREEVKLTEDNIDLEQKTLNKFEARLAGDKILEDIRKEYKELVFFARKTEKEPDAFILEIFKRLNQIVDIRGDRISIASQRLFEGLQVVALITSITFIVPFYFVGFTQDTPLVVNILVICVTLLVIFIFMIIEDFDEPFGGAWKITEDSWKRVLIYINEHQNELEGLSKKKKIASKSKRKK